MRKKVVDPGADNPVHENFHRDLGVPGDLSRWSQIEDNLTRIPEGDITRRINASKDIEFPVSSWILDKKGVSNPTRIRPVACR